jgi:predicted nucleic acid-binding protein
MSSSTIGVVCDAGPLIHLDELNCLSLLNDFDPILVPVQVWQEVAAHRGEALAHSDLQLQRVNVVISSTPAFQTLVQSLSLDLGEQAALTLMESHPQAIFLTDDAAARLAAMTLSYRVHGTIGILIRAIRRQQRSAEEVITTLRNMPTESTLFVRPKLLQEIIDNLENL